MESRLEKSIKILTELGLIDSVIEKKLEQAYIEQLKKEAFERFGVIKEGDRFDRTGFDKYAPRVSDIESISDKYLHEGEVGFRYNKHIDSLLYKGFIIYQAGKWAKKLPKRIEVRAREMDSYTSKNHSTVKFDIIGKSLESEDAHKLASQLEKYLNNEL